MNKAYPERINNDIFIGMANIADKFNLNYKLYHYYLAALIEAKMSLNWYKDKRNLIRNKTIIVNEINKRLCLEAL